MAALLAAGCSHAPRPAAEQPKKAAAAMEYFHVDPATAGTVSGRVTFQGVKPKPRHIDMDSDPGCPHSANVEDVVTGKSGGLANAFVYIQSGLEGKRFQPPATAAVLNQHGCLYAPHVIGVVAGQTLSIHNADDVSHNIHPMPKNNREWSSQQAPGAPDIQHRFPHPEVMIAVKCNVHSWMRAYIGVLDHPFFAVTGGDGEFTFDGVPPGDYTVAVWHETLGQLTERVHLDSSGKATVQFRYR